MDVIDTGSVPLSIQKHLGPPDPRVTGWLLLKSPVPLIVIFVFYMGLVFFGPRFMKNRKPFNIKHVLLIYNFSQIMLSFYIFKEFLVTSYLSGYSLTCQPVDHSLAPLALRMASACWWFFFSKVLDLLDTVFFVLRKKLSQLTFLHLYHHSTMIFNWYLGTLYLPGGQAFFSGLVNSLVHVIMYTYYLLAAIGPHMQKYLWWKRYLTQLQLLQFVAVIIHLVVGLWNKCEAPAWLTIWTIGYVSSLVVLFLNFYIKAYHAKGTQGHEKETSVDKSVEHHKSFHGANGFIKQGKNAQKKLERTKVNQSKRQGDGNDKSAAKHLNGYVPGAKSSHGINSGKKMH
ncbi:elongation of very long chain fatty acids protein 7-like [Ischnura elegans]|uniref:elongation of very long chain fatty acids protein 7-like n=1 Tax=Ischnura elegans TaxID=197161 RepID=UPI001ED88F11|nr:elongation of very long chain fatty acids protein 7-like [Ischnura elegans]